MYVLRSRKGLVRYHLVISYHDCFEKVLLSEIYYYCSLVDYVTKWVEANPTSSVDCYLLSMRWFSLEEERVMQQSRSNAKHQLQDMCNQYNLGKLEQAP